MKKVIRLIIAILLWMFYEAICDGSGMRMRERCRRIKTFAEGRKK